MSNNNQSTRHEYSPADIIAHIQRLADGDNPPTQQEFNDDGDAPTAGAVQNSFQSWNNAIQAAGLTPRTHGKSTQYSRHDIIEHIQRLATDDDPPTQQEFNDDDDAPSPSTVTARFDSWNDAVEAAGFQPRAQGNSKSHTQWTRADILTHIRRLADSTDPPTHSEFTADTDAPPVSAVRTHFGSWNTAVEAAGYAPREDGHDPHYSRDELITHIQRLADGDNPPTRHEFDADTDTPSAGTIRTHFDSWNDAVGAAGFQPRDRHQNPTQYSEDELITSIQRLADGDTPPTTAEFNADTDTPSVSTVRKYFDSWNTAVEAAGYDPHENGRSQQYSRDELISHIQRLADGDDPPTTTEFKADDDAPSPTTVTARFDTWNNALQAAGFEPQSIQSHPYSRAELLTWLINYRREFGEWPTHGTLADWSGPTQGPYRREFGTLKQALKTAQQTIDNE